MKKAAIYAIPALAALIMMAGTSKVMAADTMTSAPAVKKEAVKVAMLTPAEIKKCDAYAKNPKKVILTKAEIKKCEEAKSATTK